jgi:hypothetical protein
MSSEEGTGTARLPLDLFGTAQMTSLHVRFSSLAVCIESPIRRNTRHEYFRRILCNLLGAEMATGLLPRDFDLVGALVEDVCFRNAESFFGFELPDRDREAASASAPALHAPALG